LREPWRVTVPLLFRAVLLTDIVRLWKNFAFRLCPGRFGAILWASANCGGIPEFGGGMPAELFEKVVMS
jgi:hypothetical protein